jgi:hypothetical protein
VALGLLITVGCCCIFRASATGLLIGGPLARFDRSVADALHAFAFKAQGLTDSL